MTGSCQSCSGEAFPWRDDALVDATAMTATTSLPWELDYAPAVGLNTPSVLSIPWALDQIHPQLVIAAGK